MVNARNGLLRGCRCGQGLTLFVCMFVCQHKKEGRLVLQGWCRLWRGCSLRVCVSTSLQLHKEPRNNLWTHDQVHMHKDRTVQLSPSEPEAYQPVDSCSYPARCKAMESQSQ